MMIRPLFVAAAAAAVSAFSPVRSTINRSNYNSDVVSGCGRNKQKITPLRLSDENPAEWDDERRSNMFQALLRDLQIEGVPLLGCDANEVATFNAALWTTMAELGDQDQEQRACLIMEAIPVNALLAFAEDFTVLKTQNRLMDHLPELKRFSVSVLGRGVGPALLIETTARNEEEVAAAASNRAIEGTFDQAKTTSALKSFIDRVVVGLEACPYTKSVDISAVGLENRGITPGPVGYRFSGTTDACMTMSAFWNCICEMTGSPDESLSSIMLSLPGIGQGDHARFAAVVEIVGRYLCLFRGDAAFGLVHFHPEYERSSINPINGASYGHLPPMPWLRAMLKMGGHEAEADSFTDDELALSNYQRRAPHTAINILRMNQVNAAAGAKSIVDLDLGNGRIEKASGITLYSRNAIRMVKSGKEALQSALDADIAIQS